MPTGRDGFINAMEGWLPYVPNQVADIKRVISAGDLVVIHSHYNDPTTDAPGNAIIDIFRVDADGKISEHWDVSQTVEVSAANDNGMF